MKQLLLAVLLLAALTSCSKQAQTPSIKLAINPWPGYEFLYLASELGFYQDEGLDVELLEVASLADANRLYSIGKANAMASTLIEVVKAAANNNKASTIILVADYSNGGDVILSTKNIDSIDQLRGKKVGVELGSVGIFLLYEALKQHQLSLDDVTILNVEQLEGLNAISTNTVDALVSYPPYSLDILKSGQHQKIFDSSRLPMTIVDVLSVEKSLVEQYPQLVPKLRNVWQRTLTYYEQHPDIALQIMAKREGISVAEFKDTLGDLILVSAQQQSEALQTQRMRTNLSDVCDVINKTGLIAFDCATIGSKINVAQ